MSILKTDNKYQKNEAQVETNLPAKILSGNSTKIDEVYDNEIEATPKDSVKRNALMENVTDELDDFRQANVATNMNVTKPLNSGIVNSTTNITITELVTINSNKTDSNNTTSNTTETVTNGIYPNPNYDNNIVNSVTLTIVPEGAGLPPVGDSRWRKFKIFHPTYSTPTPGYIYRYQIIGTESSTESSGPYPAALYDNRFIDRISLTTDIYEKDSQLPPARDNKWQTFSAANKFIINSDEFKPLAGLYYDGFLNTPIKKQEFVPQYGYNYYF